MREVNVTELRNRLPSYIKRVQAGEELLITSRGKAVARLTPTQDETAAAREHLKSLRKKCRIADVISPIDAPWEADRDHP